MLDVRLSANKVVPELLSVTELENYQGKVIVPQVQNLKDASENRTSGILVGEVQANQQINYVEAKEPKSIAELENLIKFQVNS